MSDNRILTILCLVALGIPALLVVVLLGTNPGILSGLGTAIFKLLAVSAFVVLVVFEIKRLVDAS